MRNSRRFVTLLAPALVIAAAACVPSLHPIFTDDDIVFDEALLGVWSEPDEAETWAFARADADGESYRLVHTESAGKRGVFVAHLVEIENHLFLDLYPAEPDLESTSDLYKMHLLPAHTFMHVLAIEPKLQLAMLDRDWLERHLERRPGALAHEVIDDTIVLTASTRALQKFFVKHLATPGAYADPSDPMDRLDVDDSNVELR